MPVGISTAVSQKCAQAFLRRQAIAFPHRLMDVLSCPFTGQAQSSTPQDNWVPSWVCLTGSKVVVQLPAMLLIHSDVSCVEIENLSTMQY